MKKYDWKNEYNPIRRTAKWSCTIKVDKYNSKIK